MAAPPEASVRDMTGRWQLNLALSDDMTPVLALQGVSWIVRATLSRAQINLVITQTTDAKTGISTIDIVQTSLGQTVEELRVTDWEERTQPHLIFGPMTIRGRFSVLGDIEEELLSSGWSKDEDKVIEYSVTGEGWTSTQLWGFEDVNGERHHVRKSVVLKGEERQQVRMVYDWIGPVE